MNYAKPLITALVMAFLSAPVLAAPGDWGASKPGPMKEVKEKIEANQYQAAIDDLLRLVADDSNNADAYNLLGYSHRKLKRYNEAEQYYQKALLLDSKHKGAMEYLGELYVETNRPELAHQMLQRLDKVCRFKCKEYKQLLGYIDSASPTSPTEWK